MFFFVVLCTFENRKRNLMGTYLAFALFTAWVGQLLPLNIRFFSGWASGRQMKKIIHIFPLTAVVHLIGNLKE